MPAYSGASGGIVVLKSPRFASNQRLNRASENNPAMSRGESGEPVRIVQQELMDLGFSLPISTRKFGSPDGVYGNETVAKVRELQTKFKLGPDGVVGRQTMTRLDGLLPTAGKPLPPLPASGYTHKIRLHLRSIDNPKVPEFTQLKVMEQIFTQYAIKIEMASGESVGLNPGAQLTLKIVDGDCKWDQVSDEQKLLQNSGSKQNVGPNDITIYFATTLRENNGGTLQGCAGTATDRPAVMIAATAVDKTTMAHEVCHILLGSGFVPVHDNDSRNLMCSAPVCTGNPAYLNDVQLKAIRASRFLHKT
jgi:peptidoglycan hydrolase-like protein with peptidoglycan-binding domain